MRTPRPHCDLIKDWADGWEIQMLCADQEWIDLNSSVWNPSIKYRRKPAVDLKATITDGVLSLETGESVDLKEVYAVLMRADSMTLSQSLASRFMAQANKVSLFLGDAS